MSTNDKRPTAASQIMAGNTFRQLPSIQAGWAVYDAFARRRKWPETVIEIARQAYFAGAQRLADIYSAMPMDPNIVGRVNAALDSELRAHDEEMVAMREARKGNEGG
jgi:hypothetical protein